jgi:hypothetical protein
MMYPRFAASAAPAGRAGRRWRQRKHQHARMVAREFGVDARGAAGAGFAADAGVDQFQPGLLAGRRAAVSATQPWPFARP